MQIEQRSIFSHFGGRPLKWPNSVSVFEDGRIAVADGGQHRLCVYSPEGRELWQHGAKGFRPGDIREPIYVGVTPDQYLLASDWHNHRILVFRPDLNFSHTLFHPGPIETPRNLRQMIFIFEIFLKHLITDQVSSSHYFSEGEKNAKRADYSFNMFGKGLAYYLRHPSKATDIFFDRSLSVRKINGVIVSEGKVIITQKANRCLSIYRVDGNGYRNLQLVRHVTAYPDGLDFGRLCNLAQGRDGRIYVCDQDHWRIAVINPDLTFADSLVFKADNSLPRGPFSCTEISPGCLAVARSFGFEIMDTKTGEVFYRNDSLGETHGIAWDSERRFLYYVDRSNSRILQFSVKEGF